MTSVLNDIKDFIETEEVKVDYSTPKINMIFDFLTLKSIAKKSKSKINQYTQKNKQIRNGKVVLTGTRITTKELMEIMVENEAKENVFNYISKQYPSIDNEEKILYGALYEINKINSVLFILRILLRKK